MGLRARRLHPRRAIRRSSARSGEGGDRRADTSGAAPASQFQLRSEPGRRSGQQHASPRPHPYAIFHRDSIVAALLGNIGQCRSAPLSEAPLNWKPTHDRRNRTYRGAAKARSAWSAPTFLHTSINTQSPYPGHHHIALKDGSDFVSDHRLIARLRRSPLRALRVGKALHEGARQ